MSCDSISQFLFSMSVTRVATYKQLDTELKKQAGLFTLVIMKIMHGVLPLVIIIGSLLFNCFLCKDGDIDLKLLANVLSPESDITEVWKM